jgi:hypothetical protein
MLKDCNGKVIPQMTEYAILDMLAQKAAVLKHVFSLRERRKIRDRYSENYRLFCNHDLDVQGVLLDTLSHPITRY